ncbi:hypothetical protein [Rathayibacter sp. Leaf296]|uniref:hypothetical protein n=1 Tax=Rathayibacter sp. Leaf296 TaxID=1736327 RepID=UPI0007033C78|nr:hypothetical protein [Rathayibacter sp. Leaf296]
MNENTREEDLIEEPLHVVGCPAVSAGTLRGHLEGEPDRVLDIGHVLGEPRFVSLGDCPLSADAVLLLLEQVERDRVCVVSLKEPQLLAFETL